MSITSKTSGSSNMLVAVAGVIVVIALFYFFSMGSKPGGSQTTSGSPSSPSGNQSIIGPGSGAPAGTGGGHGNYYLSQTEAQSVMGSSGTYNSSSTSNSSQITQLMNTYGPNSTSSYAGSVSSIYVAQLSASSGQFIEIVFKTSSAKAMYGSMLGYTNSSITALNASSNGMTYSYLTGSQPMQYSNLIGWKNNEVAVVVATGKTVNSTLLASTVAGDLP